MKYVIDNSVAPKMPTCGKGTESLRNLLSQVSKDMYEPLAPMIFPVLGAHVSNTVFQYPDNSWKELSGMMSHLVGESGCNKGQLTGVVDAVCRDFRHHDDGEMQRLVEWQKQAKTTRASKEKPARPDVALRFPPSDVTAPAFLQNAMACEMHGNVTQYLNLPEVEMANSMCGGHAKVSQMIRNIFDLQRAGALRATADGVTGNPVLRANITISSTPGAARTFYKHELFNGTFGRMVFSYKARTSRDGRIPRLGKYPDEYYQKVDEYLARLKNAQGRYIIKPLNKLIDRIAEDMAQLADLADDDVLWDVSKRSLVSAWKAGCVMWLLNNQTWSKAMGELVEWLVYHDLWSKMQIFGDLLGKGNDTIGDSKRRGPKNLLESLPNTFNEAELVKVRQDFGKKDDGANDQLRKWVQRKFITYDPKTGLYTKTQEYLTKAGHADDVKKV